jgi:hypothetical protein
MLGDPRRAKSDKHLDKEPGGERFPFWERLGSRDLGVRGCVHP